MLWTTNCHCYYHPHNFISWLQNIFGTGKAIEKNKKEKHVFLFHLTYLQCFAERHHPIEWLPGLDLGRLGNHGDTQETIIVCDLVARDAEVVSSIPLRHCLD